MCDDEVMECCNIAGKIRGILEEMEILCILRQFGSGQELLHQFEAMINFAKLI